MTLHEDDARLTALALNELEAAEKAELEAALGDEARREVDEIARFGEALAAAYAAAPPVGLDADQRAAILTAAGEAATGGAAVPVSAPVPAPRSEDVPAEAAPGPEVVVLAPVVANATAPVVANATDPVLASAPIAPAPAGKLVRPGFFSRFEIKLAAAAAGLLVGGWFTFQQLERHGLRPGRATAVNHQSPFGEFLQLKQEGLKLFNEANAAAKSGQDALAKQKGQAAHAKLAEAIDALNRILDDYRAPDGSLPKEYEGHEAEYQFMAERLVDVEKRITLGGGAWTAQLDTRDPRLQDIDAGTSYSSTQYKEVTGEPFDAFGPDPAAPFPGPLGSPSRPVYDNGGNLPGFDTNGDGHVDLAATNGSGQSSGGGGASTGGSGGAGVSGAAAGGVAEGGEGARRRPRRVSDAPASTPEATRTGEGQVARNGQQGQDPNVLVVAGTKVDGTVTTQTPSTPASGRGLEETDYFYRTKEVPTGDDDNPEYAAPELGLNKTGGGGGGGGGAGGGTLTFGDDKAQAGAGTNVYGIPGDLVHGPPAPPGQQGRDVVPVLPGFDGQLAQDGQGQAPDRAADANMRMFFGGGAGKAADGKPQDGTKAAPGELPPFVRLNATTGPTAPPAGMSQADYEEALKVDEAVRVAVNPDTRATLAGKANTTEPEGRRLARTKLAAGDVAGALADLDRALAATPGDAGLVVLRGVARGTQGDLAGALKDLDAAVTAGPQGQGGAGALALRARLKANLGDQQGARADLDRARALLGLGQASDADLAAFLGKTAADRPAAQQQEPAWKDNAFTPVAEQALSTFSIDVDTASYTLTRRALLKQHRTPHPASVRIEEMLNYFDYAYAPPTDGRPIAAHVEVAKCPWNASNRLVRVGLQARELFARRPAVGLTFLIDVSGSMASEEKLPLVKRSLKLLVDSLEGRDRVSIVVYAGASGLVLDGCEGSDKVTILSKLEQLESGGSTNGGAGIELAYDVASRRFVENGINRVVLCTDGDWNVGVQKKQDLEALIARKAKSKVFLTVLGFGMSDVRDQTMETLADRGDGAYAFVDSLAEARRVLVDQLDSTLVTVAKDVKVQLDWSAKAVKSYRLIGYENRVLAAKDFTDDAKDAGEVGAGHSVTALYEVVPAGEGVSAGPLMTLKLRWKRPEGGDSVPWEQQVSDSVRPFDQASDDTRWAASVAAFGMVLRQSPHKGQATLKLAEELGRGALGKDPHGLRADHLDLVRHARQVLGEP